MRLPTIPPTSSAHAHVSKIIKAAVRGQCLPDALSRVVSGASVNETSIAMGLALRFGHTSRAIQKLVCMANTALAVPLSRPRKVQ